MPSICETSKVPLLLGTTAQLPQQLVLSQTHKHDGAAIWQIVLSYCCLSYALSANGEESRKMIHECSWRRIKAIGINLPQYSTYTQNFNFRSTVLPEILFDKKALLIYLPTQTRSLLAHLTPQSLSCTGENTHTSKITHLCVNQFSFNQTTHVKSIQVKPGTQGRTTLGLPQQLSYTPVTQLTISALKQYRIKTTTTEASYLIDPVRPVRLPLRFWWHTGKCSTGQHEPLHIRSGHSTYMTLNAIYVMTFVERSGRSANYCHCWSFCNDQIHTLQDIDEQFGFLVITETWHTLQDINEQFGFLVVTETWHTLQDINEQFGFLVITETWHTLQDIDEQFGFLQDIDEQFSFLVITDTWHTLQDIDEQFGFLVITETRHTLQDIDEQFGFLVITETRRTLQDIDEQFGFLVITQTRRTLQHIDEQFGFLVITQTRRTLQDIDEQFGFLVITQTWQQSLASTFLMNLTIPVTDEVHSAVGPSLSGSDGLELTARWSPWSIYRSSSLKHALNTALFSWRPLNYLAQWRCCMKAHYINSQHAHTLNYIIIMVNTVTVYPSPLSSHTVAFGTNNSSRPVKYCALTAFTIYALWMSNVMFSRSCYAQWRILHFLDHTSRSSMSYADMQGETLLQVARSSKD